MLGSLFALMVLASLLALLIGLISPRLVLPRFVKSPNRKTSTHFYSGTAIANLLLMAALDSTAASDSVTRAKFWGFARSQEKSERAIAPHIAR